MCKLGSKFIQFLIFILLRCNKKRKTEKKRKKEDKNGGMGENLYFEFSFIIFIYCENVAPSIG